MSEKIENVVDEVLSTTTDLAETAREVKAKGKTQTMVKGMAAKLAKCEKVAIKIPIDKQNPKDTTVEVQINGYVYQIKRGVEVKVPLPVKKLLERGDYI